MIPLFTSQQVREADKFAIEQLRIPSLVLMENAARSIFSAIQENYPIDGKNISVICGKGNNGGDGLALARHLIINGANVFVVLLSDENLLSNDSKINLSVLKNLLKFYPKCKISSFTATTLSKIKKAEIIVDAVFGTGISGVLNESYKEIIEQINKFNCVKVAIDIPSGLNGDSGFAETAFTADLTITLAELKRGLFIGDGKLYSGKIQKGSIGIGDEFFNKLKTHDYLIEPEDVISGIPKRKLTDNKYSSGKILVIAGSKEFIGAAALASNSALKSGGGAVVCACPKSLRTIYQKHLLEPTTFVYNDDKEGCLSKNSLNELIPKINWADSILIGPGLGRNPKTIEAVKQLLNKDWKKKFVIDADAIFALNNCYKDFNLKNKILTPHHKEFADLIGINLEELKKALLEYGRKFVSLTKSYLVLKGSPTIIFIPNGDALINTTGNPGMAKFGVGDVLSGMIASFIAKTNDLEKSIISAVYIHSMSADLIKINKHELTYTASEIIENLDYAFRFISNTFISKNKSK